MKYLFLSLALLHYSLRASSQLTPATSEQTFALVIGIANYEQDRLNLNFANRDALAFADFLRSPSGGAVAEDNIRLLTDTQATTAAIYSGLKWLKKKTELAMIQDEKVTRKVIIYFSGHGDVENNTKANLGFLLSYNTPLNNYLNNAVRISDLNDYAHTLSIDLQANVILITDACHSGKLAGSDFSGTYLAGRDLALTRDREIRIASCNPDQLSMEDARWGEGRGVFSWYLINGLNGPADRNKDKIITLDEAKKYVDSALAHDAVLKELKHVQTPVLSGKPGYTLSKPDSISEILALSVMAPAAAESMSVTDRFWTTIRSSIPDPSVLPFDSLEKFPTENIPLKFLRFAALQKGTSEEFPELANTLLKQLSTDITARDQFAGQLAEWIHTRGQEVINQYLSGDESELEKRRYYNMGKSGYDGYLPMYGTALKLLDATDPLYKICALNKMYFSGLVQRLRLPALSAAEQDKAIAANLKIQLQAEKMDDNAAFIQNEIGICYQYQQKTALAEKYYLRATELAPTWSIPQTNLAVLYTRIGKKEAAAEWLQKAEQSAGATHQVQMALGYRDETGGNRLFAEEHYRNAIRYNNRHYLPFERLAGIFLQTGDYMLADSFYHEAAMRKKGYHFRNAEYQYIEAFVPILPMPVIVCEADSNKLDKRDIMGLFTLAQNLAEDSLWGAAESIFRKIIRIDPTNPLVFHYLGKVFEKQQQWESAVVMFEYAVKYFRSYESFKLYCDSLISQANFTYDHKCFEDFFRAAHYDRLEDHFFLVSVEERAAHPEAALGWLEKIRDIDSSNIQAWTKSWRLLEKLERFTETDELMRRYATYDAEQSDRERNALYKRITTRFPSEGNWYEAWGNLLYGRMDRPSKGRYLDSIIYFPKLGKEIHVKSDNYNELGASLKMDRFELNLNGTEYLPGIKESDVYIKIPGPGEELQLAGPIYTPRAAAIAVLQKADSLVAGTDQLHAALQYKIGNVFVRAGSWWQALPWYAKASATDPANANMRMQWVQACRRTYQYTTGLQQLQRLHDSMQLSFDDRLLLGEWNVRAGNGAEARNILLTALRIYPYPVPFAINWLGRLDQLEKRYASGISQFQQYLQYKPEDAEAIYAVARMQALNKQPALALQWLEKAMKAGFHYGYVLDEDDAWQAMRGKPQWMQLRKTYPARTYREPKQ